MSIFKKTLSIVIVSSIALSTIACAPGTGPKETGGTLIGGATGAVIGSQFGKGSGRVFGTAIGTLAGAMIGGSIGAEMDAQDRQMASAAMQRTLERLPDNQASTWKNPNNQHHGKVTVKKTQENPAKHQVCRDYEHEVFIGPNKQTVVGRACRDLRDPKGEWRVVR